MPANRPQQASQTPVSPTAKGTAKYTNKDGSKFITVPKNLPSSDTSQPSTPTTAAKPAVQQAQPSTPANGSNGPAPKVNRKKQRRREKAAARLAADPAAADAAPAEQAGAASDESDHVDGSPRSDVAEPGDSDDEERFVPSPGGPSTNGFATASAAAAKKSKKKKKKAGALVEAADVPGPSSGSAVAPASRGPGISKEKIWNTSSQEERERIKEFWLGLGEDERKSLVKVEKNAVLKKMKEQQKHTCSCTVCGRKRTAIEEELEGLYDAYYLELEQFANRGETPALLDSPRDFAPRSGRGLPLTYPGQQASRGRIVEQLAEDDDADDAYGEPYSDDDDFEDDYSEDEPEEDEHGRLNRDVADFLTFGNSLQVRDDILQNDGRRFIEMMENLAERRLKREEGTRDHHPLNGQYPSPHPSAPPEDDNYDEDEDDEDEDYEDSQEDSYGDDQDNLTEEQRMEEGRRMFQIFAARMFEQRVLTAYKEKVAKERQAKLLEELDDEDQKEAQKKAKKQREAQKKKEKQAAKKQALAEEKAKKEAEKKAEEEARKADVLRKEQEARLRQDEKRKLKEAQKKAEDAEKLRRVQELKEQERKAREAKEKERKQKDELKQKEKEAREQKEKEARERREKQERDRREKEGRAKAHADRMARDKQQKDDKAAQKAAVLVATAVPTAVPVTLPIPPVKRPSQHQHPATIPAALPQHPAPSNPATFASPKIPVATPAIPKAPTPIRSRQASQQQDSSNASGPASLAGSGPSQNPSPHPATPVHSSPGPFALTKGNSSIGSVPQPSQSTSPQSTSSRVPSGPQGGFPAVAALPFHMPQMGPPNPPPGMGTLPPPPGLSGRIPQEPMFGAFAPSFPNRANMGLPMSLPPPPGISIPPGRGFPIHPPPPPGFGSPTMEPLGLNHSFSLPKEGPTTSHSRQGSQSFDVPPAMPSIIGRPAPIGRPGSVVHQLNNDHKDGLLDNFREPLVLYEDDFEKTSNEALLGSHALRGDPDELPSARRTTVVAPTAPGAKMMPPNFPIGGGGFRDQPSYMSPLFWGATATAGSGVGFGTAPTGPAAAAWGSPAPFASPLPSTSHQHMRGHHAPNGVVARRALCEACKLLQASGSADLEGYVELSAVRASEPLILDYVTDAVLLDLCETEGNHQNGGGTFDVRRGNSVAGGGGGAKGKHRIRWVPDDGIKGHESQRALGAPGEIGSPVIGSGGFNKS